MNQGRLGGVQACAAPDTSPALGRAGGVVSWSLAAGPLKGHPNMIMARNKVHGAIVAMDRAAKANHFDLAGHAAKAEQLLKEAEQEIILAAQTSNQDHH